MSRALRIDQRLRPLPELDAARPAACDASIDAVTDAITAAFAQARWPDGSLLVDLHPDAVRRELAPVLIDQLRHRLTGPSDAEAAR